ncbi:MAG: flagellar filament capping protein FliD [Deferribacterota bacterium]|nr:flagellar filament capping protein FliD [Deferribacterota bacterium]
MNDLAVGGIMSGLDTNAIVDQLVANAKKPIQRYQEELDLKGLEKETYQEINESLGMLETDAIRLNLEGTFNTKIGKSNMSSIVDVTTTMDAETGIHQVEVKQLAEGAKVEVELNISPDEKLSLALDGYESGIITIEGKKIYVSNDDSLNSLINKINNLDSGLTARYDSNTKKFIIESDNKEKITIGSSDDSSNFFKEIGLLDNINVETKVGSEGRDAIVVVDGKEYRSDTNEIKDVLKGVTLNIKDVTSKPVEITIESSVDKTIDELATFISDYNKLVERLQYRRLTDSEKENLEPLSESDRQSMTDREIDEYTERWEELNKNEIVRKSNELDMLYNDIRNALTFVYDSKDNSINTLQDLGIEFVNNNDYSKKPYLVTDSTDKEVIKEELELNTKLVDALENNSREVYNFFAGSSQDDKGLADVLNDVIDKYNSTTGIIANKIKTGGAIDREIEDISKKMEQQQRLVDQELNRLWKQFSVMEEQIGEMQSQSAYINNMISSMNSATAA